MQERVARSCPAVRDYTADFPRLARCWRTLDGASTCARQFARLPVLLVQGCQGFDGGIDDADFDAAVDGAGLLGISGHQGIGFTKTFH